MKRIISLIFACFFASSVTAGTLWNSSAFNVDIKALQNIITYLPNGTVGANTYYAGNPNGNVAGQLHDTVYDTVSADVYFCTTAGNAAAAVWTKNSAAAGDVVGPGSATSNNIGTFNGTSGRIIKDSGIQAVTYGAASNMFVGAGGASGNPSIGVGARNIGIGGSTLIAETTGVDNLAFGWLALAADTTGGGNTAFGTTALASNLSGNFNSAFGIYGLTSLTVGDLNTSFGYGALQNLTGGSYNTAFGQNAGGNYTGSESSNIDIGNVGTLAENHVMHVGTVGSGNGQVDTGYWGNVNTPLSTSINTIMYNSAANTLAQIAAVNSAIVITSAGGVPSESAILPAGLTIPGYAPLASPTFTGTPVLSTATATSINKITITPPATSATLTLADGSSLVKSGAHVLTLTTTATTNSTLPSGTHTLVPTDSPIFTGSMDLVSSTPGGLQYYLSNTATTGTPNASMLIQTSGTGGGDPYLSFLISGGAVKLFTLGIDATDGDFKICRNALLGTSCDFTDNQSTGVVSFTNTISGSITGNAATVTTAPTLSGAITTTGSTNVTSYSGLVPLASGGAAASLSGGSTGQLLQRAASNIGYTTAKYPATAGTAGTVLRSDATDFVNSTTVYPDANAINTVPYASAANVMGSIAAANNGTLQTSATGVPSFSTSQTYTPTIGDGTNNFTGGTASGWYYRYGARTIVHINVSWTGKGSAGAGSVVRISLPITSGAAPGANPFTIGFTNGITSLTQLMAYVNGTDNYVQLVSFVSGSSAASILVSGMGTSGQIQLTGTIGS